MQSVSQSHFAVAPTANVQRSKFDRSHAHKTTFDGGYLVPIFVDEALPGDTFNLNASFFARLNTPIHPILDNMYFQTFFFEIPVRQVWNSWAPFNGAQGNPGDSTDFLIPTITSPVGGFAEDSIYDHMGIPPGIEGIEISALPLRAYNLVYNDWFRDQNLQNAVGVARGDGPDNPADYVMLKRGKRHDYFTSALPWPQKSDTGSVELPLGTSAPVAHDAANGTNLGVLATVPGEIRTLGSDTPALTADSTTALAADALYADLSEATAATINQLRQSIAVQQMFERDARGGTRYIEVVYNHFGVRSPDLRLQRPGYLGGGRTQINISPVAQTTPTDIVAGVTPQGNLAAIGTLSANNHGFNKSFTEHTIILGLMCVYADLTYQQGLERMWSRQTRFDFYWPSLATIGEQEVLAKEIWSTGVDLEDNAVWGYQERYAEYRYKPSLITGQMRSTSPTSLDVWHLSQDFAAAPVLNASFIEENPPIDRVVATPAEPQFKLDSYFNLKCARPMPMYGIPGLTRI